MMLQKYRKRLSLLFAGSLTVVLAACYGVYVDRNESYIRFNTKDADNEPIKGLKTTISNDNNVLYTDTTDESGNVTISKKNIFNISESTLKIEDIDGEENGVLFKTQEINLNDSVNDYTITMEKE